MDGEAIAIWANLVYSAGCEKQACYQLYCPNCSLIFVADWLSSTLLNDSVANLPWLLKDNEFDRKKMSNKNCIRIGLSHQSLKK
jgi:hypothetical protein